MKHLLIIFVTISVLFPQWILSQSKPKLSENEVKSSGKVEFINRNFRKASESTKKNQDSIGKRLAESIATNPNQIQTFKAVSVKRISSKQNGKFDADVMFINKGAGFGHFHSVVRVLSSYIQHSFDYSEEDADLVALYVLYYNGLHRQNKTYFNEKYSDAVTKELSTSSVGIASSYKEWAGKTQIVIPIEISLAKENKKDITLDELSREVDKIINTKKNGLDDKEKFEELKKEKLERDREALLRKEEEKKETETVINKVEETKPVVTETTIKPIEEKPIVVEDKKPIVEETKPIVEETKPIVTETTIKPVEETKPVIDDKTVKLDTIDTKEDPIARTEVVPTTVDTNTKDIPTEKVNLDIPKTDPVVETVSSINTDEIKKFDDVKKENETLRDIITKKEEEIERKESFSDNVVEGKIYFLKTIKYESDGHYNNELHKLDPEQDKIVIKSKYNNICGKTFRVLGSNLLLLGYKENHNNQHRLVALNKDTLELSQISDNTLFWRTPIIVKSGSAYAIEEENEKFYLSRFDENLKRLFKSSTEINPNSKITFYGNKIYISSKEESGKQMDIIVLNKDDLSMLKKIQP